MPVDSQAKRMSAAMEGEFTNPFMIVADGTISQGDMQSVCHVYSGILACTTIPGEARDYKVYKYGAVAKGVHRWR